MKRESVRETQKKEKAGKIIWKDPQIELPPRGKMIEVLVRGWSDWVGGNYDCKTDYDWEWIKN